MKPARKLLCRACGQVVGHVTEGLILPGAVLLCASCEQARQAALRAVNTIKAKPELLRRAMGR